MATPTNVFRRILVPHDFSEAANHALEVAAETGVHVLGLTVDVPTGASTVVLGALMALILVLRPSGITGGREARLPRWWPRGAEGAP